MIQPPSSLPPTKKGSFVGTVTNQGFPFQPDVLYKSNSVVGTILKQHNAIYSCSKKGNSGYVEHQGKFSTFFTLAVEVSKSIGLIARLSKMHQERVLPPGEAMSTISQE